MVKRCAIPANFEDEMIKDQIIFGIIGNAPRERILQEKTMNPRRCTEICIAAEAAGSHAKSIIGNNKTEPDPEVSVIKQGRRQSKSYGGGTSAQGHKKCNFCGNSHNSRKECAPLGEKFVINAIRRHFFKEVFLLGLKECYGSRHRV